MLIWGSADESESMPSGNARLTMSPAAAQQNCVERDPDALSCRALEAADALMVQRLMGLDSLPPLAEERARFLREVRVDKVGVGGGGI